MGLRVVQNQGAEEVRDQDERAKKMAFDQICRRERLKALERYAILNTGVEEAFNEVVELAASFFAMPIALINFVSRERQWFKARVGLEIEEPTVEQSICKYVVQDRKTLVISDLRRDERTRELGKLDDGREFRSYLGAPLRTPDGEILGTICVLDYEPIEEPDSTKVRGLELLASQVVNLLELRLAKRRLEATVDSISDGFVAVAANGEITYCNAKGAVLLRRSVESLIGTSLNDLLEEVLPEMKSEILEAREKESVYKVDTQCLAPQAQWVEIQFSALPSGASLCLRDITEQRIAELERHRLTEALNAEAKVLEEISRGEELSVPVGTALDFLRSSLFDVDLALVLLDPEGARCREVISQNGTPGLANTLIGHSLEEMPYGRQTFDTLKVETINGEAHPFLKRAKEERGYEGIWIFPIRDEVGSSVAALFGFLSTTRIPEEWERAVLERFTPILAIGVERDLNERKLRQSEEFLRIATRIGKLGAWSYTLGTGIFNWSEELQVLYGLEEQLGFTTEDVKRLFRTEDQEHVEAQFVACLTEGKSYDDEYSILTLQGRREVRVLGEPVRDEEGEIVGARGAIQDLSELRAIELSLAASERRFRQLAEAMPFVVWTASPGGVVDYANLNFFNVVGLNRQDGKDLTYLELLHPDDREMVEKKWLKSIGEKEACRVEYRLATKENGYRWYRVQAQPVFDENSKLVKWYGSGIDIHEIKTLQKEAAAVAQRLETTLESISDGFALIDRNWNISFVNSAAEKILDMPADDLLRKNIWECFPKARELDFYTYNQKVMNERESITFVEEYGVAGATYQVRSFPVPEGIAVYFEDISAEVRTAEAIRQSEERFRILAKATSDAIWDWNVVDDLFWWSEGYERLFGRAATKEGSVESAWAAHIHDEDRDEVMRGFYSAIEANDPLWEATYRYRHIDGSYVIVYDRGLIIRDAAGKAVRMIGGMKDITERVRAEEHIREQAALLDKARDGILVRDLNHRITYWNEGATHLYGWSREEALGKAAFEFYLDTATFLDATRATIDDGEWTGELEHLTRAGGLVDVEARWTLLRNSDGSPRAILAINSDISERKRLEKQVLRAQRMETVGTLAGGIAHDLNNVLQPILMSATMLGRDESDPDRLEDINTIEVSARRGADMIRQLLLFSRGVGGRRSLVSPREILYDVQKMITDTFPKDIQINLKAPQKAWPIKADPTQMHQLLTNLCVNARDAMPDGGVLTLMLEHEIVDESSLVLSPDASPGPYVVFTVEDSGMGIPKGIIERVFDPFFTTKEVGKGTGLGLSTVHSIAKNHKGFVHLRSEAGRGARFMVYLPADSTALEIEAAGFSSPVWLQGGGETILIVDDEEKIRRVTKKILEQSGYKVEVARHGAEAVALVATPGSTIDLVITDMAMPVMDGVATTIALKNLDPTIRVIGSSGLKSDGSYARAMEAGIEHFLPKPYAAETLLRVLAKVLHSSSKVVLH